jgi:hypothetical protein
MPEPTRQKQQPGKPTDEESGSRLLNQVLDQTQSALGQIVQAELDAQIRTSHLYPRSVTRFIREAESMACLDEETASSCFYALPRGDKTVLGPSVRLAEICASCWQNIYTAARVIADDGRTVTAQGMAHDLEKNNRSTIQVKRRVTDKNGRRFSDDMVIITCNAALSIALRNAIFRVIPQALVKQLEGKCRLVSTGDQKTLATRRADMVAYFAKMGVDEKRLLAAVKKRGVEDIGAEELFTLKALATGIKDKEISLEEAFPPAGPAAGAPAGPPVGRTKPGQPGNGSGQGAPSPAPAGQVSSAVPSEIGHGDAWEPPPDRRQDLDDAHQGGPAEDF